jgi:hypothetical protein
VDVSFIHNSFTHTLVYGTILYGTYFGVFNSDKKCIAVEDILYYKGKNVSFRLFHEKLKLFSLLFNSDINSDDDSTFCQSEPENLVLLRLCIMNTTVEKLLRDTENLPYKIKLINYRFLSNSKKSLHAHYHQVIGTNRMKPDVTTYKNTPYIRPPPPSTPFPSGLTNHRTLPFPQQYPQPPVLTIPQNHSQYPPKQSQPVRSTTFQSPQPSQHKQHQYQSSNKNVGKDVVFIVRATPKDDIYNLFAFDTVKNEEVFYDVAYIPNCKSSVMMNSLFRNIKENANLDLLEESDDEEEFENTDPDKYVFLDRTFNMACIFQQKFRKWIPINIVESNNTTKVVSYQFLQQQQQQHHQKNNNNYQRR